MATTSTRDILIDLVDAIHAERADSAIDYGYDSDSSDAGAELAEFVGTGTPASQAYADSIGGDYICALEDGTIAAWGAEIARDGYTDRELVFVSPEEQVSVDAEA